MPDDCDAILLAGMVPMLLAFSILIQRICQGLAHLVRTRPRVGRPLVIAVILLIFGAGIAVNVSEGGIDESALIISAISVVTALVVYGVLALVSRR